MTDNTDLCKRLRHGFADENYTGQVDAIMDEAAATIERLEADNAALRKALRELVNLKDIKDSNFGVIKNITEITEDKP